MLTCAVRGVAAEQVLDNVAFARAHNSEQQMDLLKIASAMMSEDRWVPRRPGRLAGGGREGVTDACSCVVSGTGTRWWWWTAPRPSSAPTTAGEGSCPRGRCSSHSEYLLARHLQLYAVAHPL